MQVGASGAKEEAAISDGRTSRVRAAVASLGWVRVYGAHSHQINPNWAGVTVLSGRRVGQAVPIDAFDKIPFGDSVGGD